jgi:hypothetical protein
MWRRRTTLEPDARHVFTMEDVQSLVILVGLSEHLLKDDASPHLRAVVARARAAVADSRAGREVVVRVIA